MGKGALHLEAPKAWAEWAAGRWLCDKVALGAWFCRAVQGFRASLLGPKYLSSELVTVSPVSLCLPRLPPGMVVCNWVVILSVCITVLCVFDPTGRTFVKLRATKRRQRNLRTYNLRSVAPLAGQSVASLSTRPPDPRLPSASEGLALPTSFSTQSHSSCLFHPVVSSP